METHALQPDIESAQNGVRVKRGPVGEVEEGVEGVLKGAGKEIGKLFGK